ncbi:MAG: hypothetical protein AAGA55_08150 [Planctomycetota bacterium]
MGLTLIAFLPGLLLLALVAFAVGSAVRGILRATVVPRKYATACCPVCQYAVDQSASIAVCPECGRDLRVAGVMTPELALRTRGTGGHISGGLGLIGLIAGLVLGGVAAGITGETTNDDLLATIAFFAGLLLPILTMIPIGLMLHRRRKRLLNASLAAKQTEQPG